MADAEGQRTLTRSSRGFMLSLSVRTTPQAGFDRLGSELGRRSGRTVLRARVFGSRFCHRQSALEPSARLVTRLESAGYDSGLCVGSAGNVEHGSANRSNPYVADVGVYAPKKATLGLEDVRHRVRGGRRGFHWVSARRVLHVAEACARRSERLPR